MNTDQLEISNIILDGVYQGSYTHIPWKQVRHTADKLFPDVAVNKLADSASGLHHRWKEGHDLLVDVVGDTIPNKGLNEAFKQTQHILLTDFPSKAGIPIPGFSQSGLGQFLVDVGIPKGYLSVNLLDTGIGILAITDSASNLISALSGDLAWNTMTAFNTFGVGTVEISAGLATQNPLLIISGGTNIVAGSVSYYDYYITPHFCGVALDTLLMSFGGSFIVGGVIAYILSSESSKEERLKGSVYQGMKSGAVSTLMAINTTLGFSCIGVIALVYTSQVIARKEMDKQRITFSFNPALQLDLFQEYANSELGSHFEYTFIERIDEVLNDQNVLKFDLKCSLI